jgi:hypothetical protein
MDSSAKAPPKYTVLQFGVGWAWEQLQFSEPAWRKFAEHWKLDYRVEKKRVNEHRTPHWEKIFLVNEWFRDSEPDDVLIWADADTLPLRLDVDPRSALAPESDLAMAITIFKNSNSGVMFIRNTKTASKFFDSVWRMGPVPRWGTRWNDEARINQELPYWIRKGLKLQELPVEWNDCDRMPIRAQDPIVKAWHGIDKTTAIRRMKEEVDKITWLS